MIFVGESENGLFRLPNPIKVEINCEMNVPADELNIVFPYVSSIPIVRKIYALPDDCDNFRLAVREKNVLFSGIVDEQVYHADADNEEIVFTEIKTRSGIEYGFPAESVTYFKKQHIWNTAKYFLYKTGLSNECIRFDVIEVYLKKNEKNIINHIKNVFW